MASIESSLHSQVKLPDNFQAALQQPVVEKFCIPFKESHAGAIELSINRIGKEILEVEVIDGSLHWVRHREFSPEKQLEIRSIARTLREVGDLRGVSVHRLRAALESALNGSSKDNLMEQTVDALSVGMRPTMPVPTALHMSVYEAANERAGSIALKGILPLDTALLKIIDDTVRSQGISGLKPLVTSLGSNEPIYLGASDAMPVELGTRLAEHLIHVEKAMLISDRESIIKLGQNISLFGKEGALQLREFIASRISKFNEWQLYIDFIQSLPEELKFKFIDVYKHLSNIPKHRMPQRAVLILSNMNYFEESEWKVLLEKVIPESDQDDFRKIPPEVWLKVDQGRVAEILSEKFGASMIRNYISFFNSLPAKVALGWWKTGDKDTVLQHLGSFEELPVSIAMECTSDWKCGRVLANTARFNWQKGDFARFFSALDETGFIQVLENLDSINAKLLEEVENSHHLLEYRELIGLPSQRVHRTFSKLRNRGDTVELNRLVAEVKKVSKKMISSEPHDEKFLNHPLYCELLDAVFPQNSHTLGVPHKAHQTPIQSVDRTADIQQFHLEPKYVIDLSESVKMVLRDGKSLNATRIDEVQKPVEVARDALIEGLRRGKSKKDILRDLILGEASGKGTLNSQYAVEEKVARSTFEALAGRFLIDEARKMLLYYHVINNTDEQAYLQGTRDKASQARNRDYAILLLLREFISDRVADTLPHVAAVAMQSPTLCGSLKSYHEEIVTRKVEKQREAAKARARLDRRGITPALSTTLVKVLENKSIPIEKRYEAIASIITSEQRKIASILKELRGVDVPSEEIHLSDFTSKKLASLGEAQVRTTLEEKSYGRFIQQSLKVLLEQATNEIDGEIAKYRAQGRSKEKTFRLEAFFTKNHGSVYARRVAGVCVCDDWPHGHALPQFNHFFNRNEDQRVTQWELPNYFQLVLRDPATLRCEGLVLLHHYVKDGKKVLTASFNPTSTYLFKVNQRELFRGLLDILIQFANANDFDYICSSVLPHIRTNRTGGAFEIALNERIAEVNENLRLDEAQVFSSRPPYIHQEFNVLWMRAAA